VLARNQLVHGRADGHRVRSRRGERARDAAVPHEGRGDACRPVEGSARDRPRDARGASGTASRTASTIGARSLAPGRQRTHGRGRTRGFLWRDGQMTDLGTLGGWYAEPVAINSAGDVVGTSQRSSTQTDTRSSGGVGPADSSRTVVSSRCPNSPSAHSGAEPGGSRSRPPQRLARLRVELVHWQGKTSSDVRAASIA
jgi:uncharacterized membrane protein